MFSDRAISVYSSRVSLGRLLGQAGLLLIPEETEPPEELRAARAYAAGAGDLPGFVDAVVRPEVNAIACAVGCSHARWSAPAQWRRERAVAAAVKGGPRELTDSQKLFFLTDPLALSQLHLEVSKSPAAHPDWLLTSPREDHTDGVTLRQAS